VGKSLLLVFFVVLQVFSVLLLIVSVALQICSVVHVFAVALFSVLLVLLHVFLLPDFLRNLTIIRNTCC
jgi:glucan phosphoethanolaminetransferase (alkaline phosphatase superfamily)